MLLLLKQTTAVKKVFSLIENIVPPSHLHRALSFHTLYPVFGAYIFSNYFMNTAMICTENSSHYFTFFTEHSYKLTTNQN